MSSQRNPVEIPACHRRIFLAGRETLRRRRFTSLFHAISVPCTTAVSTEIANLFVWPSHTAVDFDIARWILTTESRDIGIAGCARRRTNPALRLRCFCDGCEAASSIAANKRMAQSEVRVAIPTSFLSAPFFGRAKKGATNTCGILRKRTFVHLRVNPANGGSAQRNG